MRPLSEALVDATTGATGRGLVPSHRLPAALSAPGHPGTHLTGRGGCGGVGTRLRQLRWVAGR